MKTITDTIKGSVLNESFSTEPLRFTTFTIGQPYRPDYNSILFITKGTATVLIDDQTIIVAKNSLLLISKGAVFCFKESTLNGYILKFGDCFWDKTPISASNCKAVLYNSGVSYRILELDTHNFNDLAALFITTLNEFEGAHYSNKADALAAYLKIIIIKIANIHALLSKETTLYDTKLYQNFRALVQQEYNISHNLAYYAQLLGVSSRKLSEICKASGTGAKEVINEQLVSEAKRLLQFSSQPIKEIAANLGFASPYQFSAFFKKHSLASPIGYRNNYVETGI